jgi:hypothetical protein
MIEHLVASNEQYSAENKRAEQHRFGTNDKAKLN